MFALVNLVLFSAVSFSAPAKPVPDASVNFLKQCAQMTSGCEELLFLELSKTYRPSKEEGELQTYVKQIAAISASEFWKMPIPLQQDAIGNILISLPATGSFKTNPAPPFALQSHMDIVLAVAGAKPGEDLRPYFKNGVDVELKNGFYQSRNNQTTLGADNGIGVAIALRYLIDPSLEHPPLELIFTVQEESGLTGAFASQLNIKSTRMLCLDGMTPQEGEIIAGSQGSNINWLRISDTSVLLPADQYDVLHLTVTNLAGGHSGGDIFRDRLNAVKALAQVSEFVAKETGKPVYVRSALAGDVGIFNKIPNLFMLDLLVAHQAPPENLADHARAFLQDLINQNPDDAANGKVDVSLSGLAQDSAAMSADFSKALVQGILKAPNGIIDRDPKYDHEILTSNNLSFVNLDLTATPPVFDLAYFTRGFETPKIKALGDTINLPFETLTTTSKTSIDNKVFYDPWLEPDSSHLLQSVLSIGTFSKKYYLNAGLEPSAFRTKIKGLEVVALGPYILEAHSVKERMKKDSIDPVVQGIHKIVNLR